MIGQKPNRNPLPSKAARNRNADMRAADDQRAGQLDLRHRRTRLRIPFGKCAPALLGKNIVAAIGQRGRARG